MSLVTAAGKPSPAVSLELVGVPKCFLAAVACDAAMRALSPAHHTLGWRVEMPNGLARVVRNGTVTVTLAVAPPLLETVLLLAVPTAADTPRTNAMETTALRVRDVATGRTGSVQVEHFLMPEPGTTSPVGKMQRTATGWALHEAPASPVPLRRLRDLFGLLLD
ncbi:hypothetical protein [Yinghuangia sp. YIM S10712]|uniref:hypothetical protein n=1 Tax=Yinghuangia sp. YIM S10712 TaxID=3436930 RepID=UPI003F52B95D